MLASYTTEAFAEFYFENTRLKVSQTVFVLFIAVHRLALLQASTTAFADENCAVSLISLQPAICATLAFGCRCFPVKELALFLLHLKSF